MNSPRRMTATFCSAVGSAFGSVGIYWRPARGRPTVVYISLPNEPSPDTAPAADAIGDAIMGSRPEIDRLAADLRRFLRGENVTPGLDLVDLDACPAFQRAVLLAESAIPRGAVSTYGRLAGAIGRPGGGRAVGQALARNPYPLLVPCHRVVGSDGRLGGYRGGRAMKVGLLRLEGIAVDTRGRVVVDSFFY